MIFQATGINFFGICIALIVIVIVYYKIKFQYWKKRNVPFLEPSIPFGNLVNPLLATNHPSVNLKEQYDAAKSKGWKHCGIYMTSIPNYLVVDLDYVKNVLTRDFQYFTDRGFYYNEKDDPLSAHLFAIGGLKWRNLRMKLSPTFTSGKMKAMFNTLVECEPYLRTKIDIEISKNTPVDIKEALGCFTTDIIGNCAFGLDCNSIQEDNSPFRTFGKKILIFSKLQTLKIVFAFSFPSLSRALGIKFVPEDVSSFFLKIIENTVNYREQNNFRRNDFLQLLIDLKNNEFAHDEGFMHDGTNLTMDELSAQCFVFFLAGFETSSTTMSFALYELAKNPDLQQKLREEVNIVLEKHNDQITYDAIQEMKYMDQVIDETLRKYPPLPFVSRQCVKDYAVTDENVIIEKNTLVVVPVIGIHYDEDIYPNPYKFDPDRFSEKNKAARHKYAHLPFGEGPRQCIGNYH